MKPFSLSTRQVRNVVTMLAAGRSEELASAAFGVPAWTVQAIHQQYGPGREQLQQSAATLLRQLDTEAGRDVAPAAPPRPVAALRAVTVALAASSLPAASAPAKPAPFQAGLVAVKSITAHPSNLGRELGDLRDLAASIKKDGIRVPVVLERHQGRYRLRDGHRRVAAAQLVSLTRVPAIVHAEALDERAWILEAIDYNLRRQGYSDDDKRRVAHQLTDLGVAHPGIAQAFGITAATLRGLLEGPKEKTPRAPRPRSVIGRRLLLERIAAWQQNDVDRDTILTELALLVDEVV